GVAPARAELVDPAYDQLLADPRLSENQNSRAGPGHLLDPGEDLPDRLAVTDDAIVRMADRDFLLEIRVFQLQPGFQLLDLGERTSKLLLGLFQRGDIEAHPEQVLLIQDFHYRALGQDRDEPAVLGPDAMLDAGVAFAEPSLDGLHHALLILGNRVTSWGR